MEGADEAEVPVRFTVAGKTFELIDGEFVQVGSDEADGATAPASALRSAQLRNTELERTNSALTKRAREAESAAKDLEFKYQLTLELLAVAQLEAEKFAKELAREKLVTETLQHELVRVTQGEPLTGFGGPAGGAPAARGRPSATGVHGGSGRRVGAANTQWRR